MNSPLLARHLLAFAAGPGEAPCVTGDLEEEFGMLCGASGLYFARRWYRRQVLLSLLPLLSVRLRPGGILAAFLGTAAPLLLLDRLWCAVYSLIPLKDGTGRHPAYFAINLAVLLAGIWLQPRRRVWCTTVFVVLGLYCSVATAPLWYICSALVLAPASQIVQRRLS